MVDDAAGLAWIVNLGCIELHPHPVRAGDLDHPDELRIDLDPGARRRVGRRPPRRDGGEGAARGAGAARLAEDQRLARHARQRAHRAALDVHRGAARGAGASRARSSGARPSSRRRSGGRRSGAASFSTTTRTPRTARPARPIRCARCPTRACRRRSHWEEVPDCEPADFTVLDHAGALRRRSAIRMPGWTTLPARWSSCSSWPRATRPPASATRRGRRTSARWRARRRASRRRARRARSEQRRSRARRCRSSSSPTRRTRRPRWRGSSGGRRSHSGGRPAPRGR